MSVQGSVYQIAQTQYGNQPHLYVAVLEFSGNKDCLIVPAFSADGFKVNEFVDTMRDQGYRPDELFVSMDNALAITFAGAHTGKVAYWLTSQFQRQMLKDIVCHPLIGQMNDTGLRLIAEHLLKVAAGKPERFSPAMLKKLRQLCT